MSDQGRAWLYGYSVGIILASVLLGIAWAVGQ